MEKQHYNLKDRLDHIAHMFNDRTAGKKYENFIVNAIYTKVGEPELIPVTQQYVKDPKDSQKYYLLDLYFPQLNYGVEVDERQHEKESHKLKDEERAIAVMSAVKCEEYRIRIYDDKTKRSYDDICQDIDQVVAIIKDKIAKLEKPLKWETNDDRKAVAIKKGQFCADDDVFYDSITEVYNLCGGKRSGPEKGKDATMLQRCEYRLNNNYKLWVPILAIDYGNGESSKGKMGFKNYLSEDKQVITEISENPLKNPFKDVGKKKVVFMRMTDRFGQQGIRFVGVFEMTKELVSEGYGHIYKRIDDKVPIEALK